MSRHTLIFKTALLTSAVLGAQGALAHHTDVTAREKGEERVLSLEKVVVSTRPVESPGDVILGRDFIETAPASTSSLTDLLRFDSGIQFNSLSRNSDTGAEVMSPLVSIRGSRPFENAYLINGIANNNVLNPGGYATQINFMPVPLPQSNPEGLMIDSDLLESVEVYSENVPVTYGDFTGGVIDARLKKPKADGHWHGSVKARYTSDKLASQHRHDEGVNQADSTPRPEGGFEPHFKRGNVSAHLSGPLGSDRLLGTVAVARQYGEFDSYNDAGKSFTNKRINDNVMLRAVTNTGGALEAGVSLIYAPYKATAYATKFRDHAYEINGGGVTAIADVTHTSALGVWTTTVNASSMTTKLDADSNHAYSWDKSPRRNPSVVSHYATWDPTNKRSSEGLFGDMTLKQKTVSAKSVMVFDGFEKKNLYVKPRLGFEVASHWLKATDEDYFGYMGSMWDPTVEGTLEEGVVAHEQYLAMRDHHIGGTQKKHYVKTAGFADATINVERFTFRPGIRVTHDTLTKNTDVAPRVFAQADVFNNDRLLVSAGWSRYYGNTLISRLFAYKNKPNMEMRQWKNGAFTPWKAMAPNVTFKDVKAGDLKTPFSNELAFNVSTNLPYVGTVSTAYIERHYKDQLNFVKADEWTTRNQVYELVNNGESKYRGVTLGWEKAFDLGAVGKHRLNFSTTWSKTESSTPNMYDSWQDDTFTPTRMDVDPRKVMLDGEVIPREALPAEDFNVPMVFTLTDQARFWDDRLLATLMLRFERAHDRIVIDGLNGISDTVDPESMLPYRVFVTEKLKSSVYADLNLTAKLVDHQDRKVEMSLDITNLFDKKNEVNHGVKTNARPSYQMGRQFFVGLKVQF